MQIIPVIDILEGRVVRGVAGRRAEYRPVQSGLTTETDPVSIARAFQEQLGLTTIYIADLDAILHARPNWEAYQALTDIGCTLWIDAGLRSVNDAESVLDGGAACVVAGLETWPSADSLHDLLLTCGRDRVIFSLDLHAGAPLSHSGNWHATDAFGIADEAICAGVQQLIVLDLADVGVGRGVGTQSLCQLLTTAFPHVKLIAGGGVRDLDDVRRMNSLGVDAVLIASALHNGMIDRRQLDQALQLETSPPPQPC